MKLAVIAGTLLIAFPAFRATAAEGLVPLDAPRPWGDTFLPRSAPPAKKLLVVEVAKLKPEERGAIGCLQGLSSRREPRLWLIRGSYDQFWLDWHKQKGYIDGYEVVADWRSIFKQFAKDYRGAIVADPNLYRGDVLALNVAACEDLILATPELAERLNLPIKVDLRGRFKTYVEGMQWLWATYKDRISRHLSDYLHPARVNLTSFAYTMQWRGLMFWIAGPAERDKPGTDSAAEEKLMNAILAEMAPNTAVLGFPWAGEGVGIGEPPGVKLISRYGKGLVCSDSLGNICITSGVRIARLNQPKQAPPPALEKDKVYIAMAMSDGDNLNIWTAMFKAQFEHRSFGKFPLAYGMGPAIYELEPAVAQWYYEHGSPNTEFIADVSGASYTSPDDFGTAFADRQPILDGYVNWTARLMQPMGMRTVRTVGGNDEQLSRYAKGLPFCHSLFADMGCYSGRKGIDQLTYRLPDGMTVFRAATTWRHGKEGFLKEIREQVGTKRPAFVNGFVHCWTFGMDDLLRIYERRDPDMVFVTPAQLAELYKQAKK
ncbi:MAG: hypothetical protein IT426_11200 [Pirellulales bacterium]|nr:hypothetical protein [Pirellulales bacterium]